MRILPKKSLGQNFLTDNRVLNLITDIGKINRNDTILEVGPGTGALTKKILEKKPKKFIVIEKDKLLTNNLKKKFGNSLEIINDDMLNISYENLYDGKIIIFGNLPYNISTQILAKWIRINNLEEFCKKFILMFQKEVADRIITKVNDKNYGRLSILSNWKLNIEKVIDIGPESFDPSPKVKSTLLIFTPKKKIFKLKNSKNLEHITNIFFSQRRKMVKKPMKFLFKNFNEVSEKLSIDLTLRPQNLDSLTYYKICKYYEASIY
tara:strand:- start:721 stop:1512 length:792 start_codon:yes stop_codon:yes gene_type:complete